MPTFLADSHFSYILNSVDIFSLLSIPFFGISTIYWLPLFFIIFLWWIFFREKVGIPTPNLLMKQYSRTPFSLLIIWMIRVSVLSLLFLLFIRAWGTSSEMEDRRDPEQATIIALDISKSMETDDLSPSRIEYAKNIILEHTDTLGHLGVVIFAGKTFILSPITTDTRGINYLIETLSTDTINQNENETSGTNIGDSIIQASTIFPQGTKEKRIILITDGRANTGLDPLIAAESLRDRQITLSAIALGSASGIALNHLVDGRREPLLDSSGNTINGSVDIPTLSRMTEITGGKLIHIDSIEGKNELDSLFGGEKDTKTQIENPILDDQTIALFIGLLGLLHLFFSFFFWGRYKTR